MKALITILTYLFTGLEVLTSILVFPLTFLCAVGLIGFTFKIAGDIRAGARREGPPLRADRLPA
jgi:hypothetical protein